MLRFRRSSLFIAATLAFVTSRARAENPPPPAVSPTPRAAAAASPSTPASASASVDDPVRAKALSDEAVQLANDGDFAAACVKLEQSLALHDGLGTKFHLAGCWSKTGRTASAYALFDSVATKAHELGQSDREELARTRMEGLLPKLSRLRIDLANPAPHTEVRRDDTLVPESDWGKPVPVDAGTHEIRVSADGKSPWSTKLDVSEAGMIVAIPVPALADAPNAAPVNVAPVVTTSPAAKPKLELTPAPSPAPVPTSDGSTQRTLAIVAGSVGIAALAAGIIEGAQYLDSNRDAKGICPSGLDCSEDEISRHDKAVDQARNERMWSYVGVGVGSAAVAGAAYLFFSAPHAAASTSERASAFSVAPLVDGRGTWGGVVQGAF